MIAGTHLLASADPARADRVVPMPLRRGVRRLPPSSPSPPTADSLVVDRNAPGFANPAGCDQGDLALAILPPKALPWTLSGSATGFVGRVAEGATVNVFAGDALLFRLTASPVGSSRGAAWTWDASQGFFFYGADPGTMGLMPASIASVLQSGVRHQPDVAGLRGLQRRRRRDAPQPVGAGSRQAHVLPVTRPGTPARRLPLATRGYEFRPRLCGLLSERDGAFRTVGECSTSYGSCMGGRDREKSESQAKATASVRWCQRQWKSLLLYVESAVDGCERLRIAWSCVGGAWALHANKERKMRRAAYALVGALLGGGSNPHRRDR